MFERLFYNKLIVYLFLWILMAVYWCVTSALIVAQSLPWQSCKKPQKHRRSWSSAAGSPVPPCSGRYRCAAAAPYTSTRWHRPPLPAHKQTLKILTEGVSLLLFFFTILLSDVYPNRGLQGWNDYPLLAHFLK